MELRTLSSAIAAHTTGANLTSTPHSRLVLSATLLKSHRKKVFEAPSGHVSTLAQTFDGSERPIDGGPPVMTVERADEYCCKRDDDESLERRVALFDVFCTQAPEKSSIYISDEIRDKLWDDYQMSLREKLREEVLDQLERRFLQKELARTLNES